MKSTPSSAASLRLTGGNIRNNHFYVKGHEEFTPPGTVGGPNTVARAANSITVTFVPRETIETDIAGDKMILRNRSAVGDFFERISAKEGDRIVVEYDGGSEWFVFKAPD